MRQWTDETDREAEGVFRLSERAPRFGAGRIYAVNRFRMAHDQRKR